MSAPIRNGRFCNQIPGRGNVSGWNVLRWMLTRKPPNPPQSHIEPVQFPQYEIRHDDMRIVFIGHCTLVVEVGGKRILTDPVFGPLASPLSFAGPRRYHPPGVLLEDLPPIDYVLISHNHYDHLEEDTIRRLATKCHFFVPKGLGPWMKQRGCDRVTELNWWEDLVIEGIKITATPCQHWSKRTFFDERKSLWCGYALEFGDLKFLFIGDSGYYEGFAEIGRRLGPFHIAALPIGSYNPSQIMAQVHMTPEEAVQAYEDVQATIIVPTHYGCFPLTDEDPTEPPRRLYMEWRRRKHDLDTLWLLAPGQYRSLEHMIYIPTVRPQSRRVNPSPEFSGAAISTNEVLSEWGIAICPHKGEMVDLRCHGHRENVYTGDDGKTLVLDDVQCSSFGCVDQCKTAQCPLRDPSFLRSYDLHGIRQGNDSLEVFVEMEDPPSEDWWEQHLRISLLESN